MSEKVFDSTARAALQALLENFWIPREKDPETYQLIRDREKALRDYVLDKLGYHLIVHRHFAKLEKIPAVPEAWMGIESFKDPRDYALLCCVLAFLENKAVEEQFLLSDLCTELEALYPGELALDWRNFEHRKSLVRVLQFMTEMGMLEVVDGDTGLFNQKEETEALYEVTVISRYFMRSYPKDLFQFQGKEDILAAEAYADEDENGGSRRRYRVYRQLLLSPAIYEEEMEEGDFLYLRNFRRRLQEDLAAHTGLELELYKRTAMLIVPEYDGARTLFPDQKGICDLALQLSSYLRDNWHEPGWTLDHCGNVLLTEIEFRQVIKRLQEIYGAGWSKQYREGLLKQTAGDLLEFLGGWKMAAIDSTTRRICLRPALTRLAGEYPQDFTAKMPPSDQAEMA
ncbi:MAG: TIGR02678 family protein [Desulfitobacteriia bacterium]|jgi:uncharacterized protein (TIGR02678 family)